MRAGRYGPIYNCGGIRYVALEGVEKYLGITVTDEQLEAASAGLPDRIVTINEASHEQS